MLRHAPIPCPACGGWVDQDGQVMDRPTTLARYPFMQQIIDVSPGQAPDVTYQQAHPTELRRGVQAVDQVVTTSLQLVKTLALMMIAAIILYLILRAVL